jgi:PII-like signaling protein
MIPPEASLLRAYVTANERWHGAPLYRAIVEKARALHLAGASVFRVELSYGAHRLLHDAMSEYTSYDIPVVIEVVDAPERVVALVDELGGMVGEGLVVTRAARVVRYSHATERGGYEKAESAAGGTGDGSPGNAISQPRGATTMKIEGEAKRVTVYIGSSDTWNGQNLGVALVERCREMGMAGATVCRGVMGFG